MNVACKFCKGGSKKINIIISTFINSIFDYYLETTSVYRERSLQRNAGMDVQTEM